MKILADIDIPLVKNYFGAEGELVLKPGRMMAREDLQDVDLLLVRSVTQVNEKLLQGTPVKWVGSVTTGTDHIDTIWLKQAGIQWCAASGYNAIAVSDYIMAVLAALFQEQDILPALRVGVIGVGHVGSHVANRFKNLGCQLFLSDPPRALREKNFDSHPLSVFPALDLVTVHTPLTRDGQYPTHHLIDAAFLDAASGQGILINASRGAVFDFEALEGAAEKWRYCFDVWESEPQIDLHALSLAEIATPHLAGHSVQSRYRGIDMIYRAACESRIIKPTAVDAPAFPRQRLSFEDKPMRWQEVVLKIFNPLAATEIMKKTLLKEPQKCATLFDNLRRDYIGSSIKRHEFDFTTITRVRLAENDRQILTQFGITIEE